MKILLVDDEKKFVTMLAKRMQLRGFETDVTTDGETALNLAKETNYDLAVLDIKMPGISGHQLRDRLSDLNRELKFIFVTGHGGIDRAHGAVEPLATYLSKPLDIGILIKTIEQLLSKTDRHS